ncbi:MAG: T9SS type A sorting domain-containing protein [Bacteroidota bacterium]
MHALHRGLCLLLVLGLSAGTALAQDPGWTVQPSDFQRSMTVVGQVMLDGTPTTGDTYQLAAFHNNEVRGLANAIEVAGQWFFFLTLYANTEGDTLTFAVYDRTAEVVLDISTTLAFASNALVGTTEQPFVWEGNPFQGVCRIGRPVWTFTPTAFESTMTITGRAEVSGVPLGSGAHQVAAFINGDLRGLAEPIQVGAGWYFFMTVYGSGNEGEVRFKVYDAGSNRVHEVVEILDFAANASHGTPSDPQLWSGTCEPPVRAANEVADQPSAGFVLEAAYPNPFRVRTTLSIRLDEPRDVQLRIHDALGREVYRLADGLHRPGDHTFAFDATELPSGLYLAVLQAGTQTQTRTLILVQ